MKILRGKRIGGFREAAGVAFQEAGYGDMSAEVAELFTSVIDTNRFRDEADRAISSSVHGRYGRNATWSGKRWLIPVPRLGYNAKPIPQLAITIHAYLVSPTEVETTNNYYSMTLVRPLGQAETLVLPMSFLQAILNDDLEQFEVVGRDGRHTAWNIPGFKEAIRLPNDFTTTLSNALRLKTVAHWLLDFGFQGRSVAPWVVGTLIGLQLHGVIEPLPLGQQKWKRESVLDTLTQMFGTARAKEMFEQALPYLKANMTNEEVIRLILQESGRGYK